ncbi:gliding motility-associated C-terminal domain-containing protein [Flavobacterium micromati]|uniref:Gliding motility-associated C-terminal domain-containing protein n=1 Tax=Flavobacterium micromati TaxID=229205 RepID=A0A1M5KTK9_9FLAO|nr:T9SS type B sorting domain-containing protein [Flavobacterium micromati]SHG56134.1 gliding motility-associated C-terminal domain-containing protein [Flavobacterium micromati]
MEKTTFSKRVTILKATTIFIKSILLFLSGATPICVNSKRVQRGLVFQMIVSLVFSIFIGQLSYGQIGKGFTPRLPGPDRNIKVKGDVVLIGNTVINKVNGVGPGGSLNPAIFSPSAPQNGVTYTGTVTNLAALTTEANLPYNDTGNNNSFFVEYIDIDNDNSTFSSSTANLNINNSCKKIVFAGLYWSAIYPYDRSTNTGNKYLGSLRNENFDRIKFKVPNATTYLDLVADEKIFDGYKFNGPNVSDSFKDSPYVCFKDVTSLLSILTDADGPYTVANVRAARGKRDGGGAGGWTLVVIYESPTVPSKFISIFDGYVGVNPDAGPGFLPLVDFAINGFRTLPAPFPVRAKMGVAALEGDLGVFGDTFQFKASTVPTLFTPISDVRNPANNFFNASITDNGVAVTNRSPNSSNTLGFDIDNVVVANANNEVVPNNETGATLRLTTSGDGYGAFVATFAVDIIEPAILLTKEVKNSAGNDIGGANVALGDQLEYVIGFENQGNDDATNFTIKDILPNNIIFNYPADLGTLPPGVTHSYTPANRTLIFTIPNNLVVKNLTPGPPFTRYEIRFKVRVVPTCADLSDACDNRILNSAFATYRGSVNATQITDDPSLSSFTACNLGTPQATNFLVGVSDCLFTKNEILCGASKTITARNGYASYTWTGPFGFNATGQTVTVTRAGVYSVFGVGNAPCTDYNEVITVAPFGGTTVNPINAFADNKQPDGSILVCPNNGKELPKIFLCGLTASRLINTGITGANSIVWETTNCVAPVALSDLCANESASCTWTSAGPNGPSFLASAPGQFRVTINYDGGCFNQYYFNVYKNVLDPQVTATDIICTTPGRIVVNNVPSSGYEFSIDGVNYQTSNTFVVNVQNTYTVYVRQQNIATNPCVFEVLNVIVRRRNFTVTANASQPLCFGGTGNVLVVANDVNPQYTFNIYLAGSTTLLNTSGLQTFNQFTFGNLAGGSYDVEAITQDGCIERRRITINTLTPLTASAAVTKPITCTDGQITVTQQGGTFPYSYSINNAPFVTDNVFNIPSPGGTFSIQVVDSNNCSVTLDPVIMSAIPAPTRNTTSTDVKCYNDLTGTINFNVTNANGYTLAYSIDNGATYGASANFTGLAAGTYNTILRYTLNGDICLDTMRPITISQPAAAVTASAGVSELAGCGIAPNTNFGRVRITNPQGGVGTYEYSFDNQASWSTVNNALVAPGTYTLFVRDANRCIFSAPVTLDPEPVAPVIDVAAPVDFNCDGSATSKVTVNNPGGVNYTYVYSRNGVVNTNTPPNEFINVPPGTHKITVAYNLGVVPTFSNLLFENFGYGDDTTSPGMNAIFYCFERQVVATQCRNNIQINDGDYSVTARIISPFGPWLQPGDHTPPTIPPTPRGRALVVNIGDQIPVTEILYEKVINNIIPNQPINVEFFAFNLLNRFNNQANPDLRVALIDASGTEISFYNTGEIPKSERWENYPKTPVTLNPGANTTLRFIVRSNVRQTSGNDVAIDDIRVYQLPKTCITTRDFTIFVPTGKAFAAQITGERNVTCAGAADGQFTINVQNFDAATGFQYSIDNGATFTTSLTSPVTITSRAAGTFAVVVRPDAAAIGACSKPFSVIITEPTAVTADAIRVIEATCTTGATIRATGGGGTPAYQYELRAANGITIVRPFSNNRDFTNVPAGDYTVFVTDANGCSNPAGTAITVTAPPALTATLDSTTDYCYTTANPATLVINVSGGVGPFTYKLDSNASVSSALTTFSFSNVTPGTHTVLVTDSNNCTTTLANIVIAPALTLNLSLLQDLTCLVNASIGNELITGGNGTPYIYTVSYNGTAATAVSSFPYAATLAGTYVFTITDSRGCPATSNTITVTPKTTPTHATAKTDITCNGLNNGSITITASGGFTTTYTYAIKLTTATSYTTQPTNQFTGLAAGTYDIKVIDSKGCESVPSSVTIVDPAPIVITATATNFTCSPTNTKLSALVTIGLPTGGTGTYFYSFNGGGYTSTNTLTVNDNGTDQIISYRVRDVNGCLSPIQTITILRLNPPTDLTFTNPAITCIPTATTTTVTVTAINGVGILQYETIAPSVAIVAKQTSNTFAGLLPGLYTFRVTDANGCFYTESYTIAPVTPIAVTAVKLSDVACFGDNTGSARFTVTGFSAAGNYNIVVTTTPASLPFNMNSTGDVRTLTNLVAGTYTFTVTDNTTGCTDFKSITINQPVSGVSITSAAATPVFCSNDNSQITITATGGTPSYGYAAVPSGATAPTTFGTSNVVTVDTNNGTILSWDVYVRDANGCLTPVTTVTIINDGTPNVTATVTNQCTASGSTFQIEASATGGLAPYTYTINTGVAPSPANTFTVAAGTYTITVRDANGCTATTTITVNQRLTAVAAVTKDITCSAPAEATIRVNISGGFAPFTYRVRTVPGTYSGGQIAFTGNSFIYTAAGTTGASYEFEITDANGCVRLTNTVNTNTITPVAATAAKVDPTCNGFTDGSIRLTATAGVAPFTYSISGVSGLGSSNVFGGLAAGSYNYIVRDAKGCDATGTIVLVDPAPIAATISPNPIQCNGNVPGSIDVTINSGGVAPFTYSILNNAFTQIATSGAIPATTFNFAGLGFGDYYIRIIDANGCEFQSARTRILTPPNIVATGNASTGTCATGATVEISVITGFPNFTYQIFGQPSTAFGPTAATSHIFPNLIHGTTYQFQVIDAGGCFTIVEVTTPPSPSSIAITGTVSTNVTCNGTANGTLAFTVQNFDPTVTTINYQVLNALTLAPLPTPINGTLTGVAGGPFTGNITTLPAGNYVLRATEATGTLCSASYTFTITQPAQPLVSNVTANVNADCNTGALVTLTTTGGTGPYTYAAAVAPGPATIFNPGNVLTLNPGAAGTDLIWIITVRDANGCTVDVPVTIAVDPSPVIALEIVNKCVPQGIFEIRVTQVTAGTGAYTISVDGSAFTSITGLPHIVPGLNSGSHTISIRDTNGCTDTETIIIDEPLVATPAITALPTCANNDGVITMTGTGGPVMGTYTYTIAPTAPSVVINNTTGVISGLPAGTYTITMTDTATPTPCTTTAEVTLSAAIPVTFTTATTPALCVGDSNGTITVTLLPGNTNPDYTYAIIAGPQTVAAQSSNIFTGLLPGTYTIRVNSGQGCSTDDANVVVAPATALTASAAFAANTTCSTTTLITVTPTGGTPGYTYNFNSLGFTTDNTFTVNNGPIATITTIVVRDANGCTFNLIDVTTPAFNPPTGMDVTATPIYCAPVASLTSTVTITNVINGAGMLTYQILSPATATSNVTGATNGIFIGLVPDDYMFQVTDSNGCTYQELLTIAPVNNITATVSATTNVSCFGLNNGTATITVANFATTYTASLTAGTGTVVISGDTVSITGMQPGNYTLRVTDATTGCIADVTVTITQPTATLASTSIATNTNCDNDNSTITITATDGTPAYQYAVARLGDPVPTVFISNNVFVVDTNGGLDMAWTVYVTDANGCTTSNLQNIILDASPSAISVASFSECPDVVTGNYTFTVNTPTGVAPFTYSIGGGFQTSPTFIVNAAGTYDVTVKDANGCTTTATALVVIRQPLILTATVTVSPSCTDGDGVITVATLGGSGNYEYRIDTGVYPMVIPFTGISSGPHIVYVRDTTTGCEASVAVNLQAATPITGFAVTKTDVICNGGNDGTITATLDTPAAGINDNPIYTFALTGTTTVGNVTVTRPAQESRLFSGLAAGTYTVTVTSGRGCTASETIDVIEPTVITVPAPVVVQFGCIAGNTSNLATITVNPLLITGGSGVYLNYEFLLNGTRVQFGSSNVYTEANLAGGTYTVNVVDDKGCIGSTATPVVIAPYVALDKVNVNIDQAITCTNFENISVTATTIPVGATANLEYTIVAVTYDPNTNAPIFGAVVTSPTGIFTGLVVGDYLITVRNLDTNCEIQGVHYVNEPNTFDLTIDTLVDVICLGGNDGRANITFVDRLITTAPINTNDAGPFSYTVVNVATPTVTVASGNAANAGPITIPGLAAGTYTVTATLSQSPFCTVSKNFTITGPNVALDITETHTEITCVSGNNDGTISVAATGGWPGGYQYELNLNGNPIVAYGTQTEFTGLVAGNYIINVRDSKGCIDQVIVVLANPTLIVFTATPSAALSCFGDTTASITASAPTGGSGSYLYTLITTFANGTVTNNGPQLSNIFTNLGAASYQVKVTDSWGCETTAATIRIAPPALVTASLVLASANTCNTQATLTLTAAGGTGPYIYSVDPNFTTSTTMTGSSVTFSVAVGTYNYYIRDDNGCTSFISNDIKIDAVPTLTLAINDVNATISCRGDSSGVIVATAQGGLGNYVYTLLDGSGNPLTFTPTQTTPGNFTNLPAGSYTVRVVSIDCLEQSTVPIVITEPAAALSQANVVTNVTCAGEGDGTIVITASGGTGIIKYAISPNLNQFFESNVFDDLRPGFYDYIVQDQNGCFIYITGVEITEPNSIFVTTIAGSEMPEVCTGDNDAAFSVNITGGNAPYSVSINNRNGTYTNGVIGQTQFDFAGLTGSEHIVYVRDASGCTTEHTVILGKAVTLNPQATVAYDCISNSASNSVTITVDPSNNQADLDYALDGSGVFQSSNVFNNLTVGLHSVEVRHSNGCIKAIVFGILRVDPLTLTLADGGLNEIVATATGGITNYQFSLDGESAGSQSSFIITKSGNYTVTVTDASGCTATATRFFEFVDIKIPNAFTPNGDGNNDTWAPTNTINYKDLTFDVFDRYGRRIGKYTEGQFWDGRYNGAELPSGDYWYVVKIKQSNDGREFVGHFTLYR